jgi:glutathione synthase/RimK-type ligase-like ATP-grasp enzyme
LFSVLLACYANWDSCAETPYLLKQAGCNVDVYCSENSWLLSNSYYDNWIFSEKDEQKYALNLEHLVKKNNYDWVVLTDDVVINLMNTNLTDEVLFCKIMPIKKIQNRFLLSSKVGLSKFCFSNNIDSPNFCVYNNKDDLNSIKNNLNFPVVNKTDFGNAGINMEISNSFEDFQIHLTKIKENNSTLIQEYLKGEDIQVEALFFEGYLVTYLTSTTLSTIGNIFSPITRRNYFYDEKIKPILSKMGEMIGLNGFVNITYIKFGGKYYLIEVDPRINSWMAHSRFVTSDNFINGVKKIINGDYKKPMQFFDIKYKDIEVAYFLRDIHRIIKKNRWLDIHKWLFNIKGYWKYIPLYDIRLFNKTIKVLAKILLVKIKHAFLFIKHS